MSLQQPQHEVDSLPPVPESVDIPVAREYGTEANAELDRSLCDAIQAAQTADNDYLATLLAFELGSHYYDTR
jgi:hypothetical protein